MKKLKKWLVVCGTAVCALCLSFGLAGCGDEESEVKTNPPAPETGTAGLAYTLSEDGTHYVASGMGTCTQTKIVIADTYKDLPVTSIAREAFYGQDSLTNVTIGSNVKTIGNYAFWGCGSLSGITIPSSVTKIGGSAFGTCTSLTNLAIPNGVTEIGDYAFSGCTALTGITVPQSVTKIGRSALSGCTALSGITIPNKVESIGTNAFYNCKALASITVENGNTVYHSAGNCLIESATKTLIAGCKTSVIPSDGSVTSIGGGAFIGCSSLTSLTIPGSVTSIGDYAFDGCVSLTEMTIPNSVTKIGKGAFIGCSGLTGVTFKNKSGWKVSEQEDMSHSTSVASADLENNSTAVQRLTSKYYNHYWKRG